MKILEEENELSVKKIEMNCDKIIQTKKGISVAPPLCKTSHLYLFVGASGSGKTNLVMSLLKRRSKTSKGDQFSYSKMFDNIVFVSPSAHTIKNNPLEHLDDNKKFNHFTDDVIDTVEELTEDAVEDDIHTLLILDDVSSELRKSKPLTQRLNILTKNRRHKNLSIWIIGHRIYDFDPALRANASLLFVFKPKSIKEVDVLRNEFMNMNIEDARNVLDYVFEKKFTFLMIDASLRHSGNFEFFKNFNKLNLIKEEKELSNNIVNGGKEKDQKTESKEGAEK